MWGVGYNYYGQLGNGRTDRIKKHLLKFLIRALKILLLVDYHTLVHKEDGSVWGMGYNSYGQLGNGRNDEFKQHLLKFLIRALKIFLLVVTILLFTKRMVVCGVWVVIPMVSLVMVELTDRNKTPVKIFDKGIKKIFCW